jgi:LacI family transcriptional regulator
MKDIAAEFGVSVVTVSRALRDRPDIAKETRVKIVDRARRLNYRPNLMARSLATGRSSLIGLVVPDLIHPFFSEIAKGLSAGLKKNNYFLIISSSESDPILEQDEIEHMLAHRLDCFVVASCQRDTESLLRIGETSVPLVLIDRSFPGFSCNFVGVDDYKIGEVAAAHLIAQGYTRIAHIRGPSTIVGNRRSDGFCDTVRQNGLPVPNEYVIVCREAINIDDEAKGKKAMEEALALRPRPDAIFCFNDSIAIGAMTKAFEMGVQIPKEIALLGCGNFHYSSKLRVPLSSIDQKAREIGKRSAELVLRLLKRSESRRPSIKMLEPELVVRASSHSKKSFIEISTG